MSRSGKAVQIVMMSLVALLGIAGISVAIEAGMTVYAVVLGVVVATVSIAIGQLVKLYDIKQ